MKNFKGRRVNIERVLELENHFAIVMVKIRSARNHQHTLNLGGNFDVEQYIPVVLSAPQTTY